MRKLMKLLLPPRQLGRRPAARFHGFLDNYVDGAIKGWAFDWERPGQTTDVVVVLDDEPIAILSANIPRADLKAAAFGTGEHGFHYPIVADPFDLAVLDAYAVAPETSAVLQDAVARSHHGTAEETVSFSAFLREHHVRAFRLRRTPEAVAAIGASAFGQRRPALARDAEPITLIEIQDLVLFLRDNRRVTGIQRVVSGLIKTTLDKLGDTARTVEFCTVGRRPGEFAIWPKAELGAFIKLVLEGEADQAMLRVMLAAMLDKIVLYTPRAGDTFIISGAYWIVQGYGSHLLTMRTAGCLIGAFIYDLIPITSPQWVTRGTRIAVEDRAVEIFSVADFFLTISSFVKSELDQLIAWELGGAKPSKAVLLPHELPNAATIQAFDGSSLLPDLRSFVLCVGTLEGRKNHMLLFRVWSAFIRCYGPDAVPSLVLVGKPGWLIEEFLDACEAANYLDGKIVVLSGLADHDLADLYQRCLLTVFPSFAEGWGLPVGESLAAGKLCVASRATSIPEVGGDLADYLDPHDYFEALRVLDRAVFDPAYRAEREAAIASGFRRRTWYDFSVDFHEAATALVQEVRASGAARPDFPLLEPDRFYDFAALGSPQTSPWQGHQVKLILAEGWKPLEWWGTWSRKGRATLSFFTGLEPNTLVTVWLRLSMPPGQSGEAITLRGLADDAVTTRAVQDTPTMLLFATRTGPGGEVRLAIERVPSLRASGPYSDILVGFSGIAFHASSDEAAGSRVMMNYLAPSITNLSP